MLFSKALPLPSQHCCCLISLPAHCHMHPSSHFLNLTIKS